MAEQKKVPLVEFREVVKTFNEKLVLDGISFAVEEGKTLCIIGGSGTGKSVTLKLLMGLMPFDSGEIFYRGQPLSEMSEVDLNHIRGDIGMVFQGSALFDSLSVYDNVAYPLVDREDLDEAAIDPIVMKRLELVGLKDSAELFPSDLSGGMQKRVGFARAIAKDPHVILYDEPTAGLDPTNVNRIDGLIRTFQEVMQVTSIVVTHNMPSVNEIADRVALLYNKKLAFSGTLEEFRGSRDPVVVQFIEGKIGE
jgi:phospholipid/cholesterol/gamma-HCH transport system ATP-binding protein